MAGTADIKPILLDIRAFVAGDTNQEELLTAYLLKHSRLSLDVYNEALDFINACLQEKPNHARALVASAVLRLQLSSNKLNSTALNYLDNAITQGSLFAKVVKGICLCEGIGIAKNPDEAVRLFRTASDAENSQATYSLAVCYYHGIGITKDPAEAVRLYRIASDAGNNNATYNLAICYQDGIGITKNLAEAVRLYRLAIEQGNSRAAHNLAYYYNKGIGIAKDLVEATKLYIKAINSDNETERYQVRFKRLVNCLEELQYQRINPSVLAKWCAKMRKTLHDNSNCLSYIKKILRRLMAIYTEDDVVQYHAIMALYDSSWGARIFSDYIRKLIDQDPDKFMAFLIDDEIHLPKKKKYYEYIQARHLKTLSGEHVYVILYELNLLPTFRTNRCSFFSLLPPNLLEGTVKKLLSSGSSMVDEDIELALTRSSITPPLPSRYTRPPRG